MGSDHEVVGKIGRLSGEIAPGRMGEVMIPIRGGSEAYYAYAVDPEEAIPRGARVVVIEHEPAAIPLLRSVLDQNAKTNGRGANGAAVRQEEKV